MGSREKIYSVNLEELVGKYVWRLFKEDLGVLHRLFVRRNHYYIDIPWAYVDFKHTTVSTERPSSQGEQNKKNVELYFSEYENRTDKEQEYTFSTSRETIASTKVELQENYTIGAETNLEVDLGFVTFGGGGSGSISITNTSGQDFSETLSWNIETKIIIPKWQKVKASQYVCERPSICDFTTKTVVSLPSGKLPCSVRRVSDNKLMRTYTIMNIGAIFDEDYLKRSTVEVIEVEMPELNKIVNELVLTSQGVCKNISYKNQNVQVESENIDDAPPEAAQNDENGDSTDDGGDSVTGDGGDSAE